MEGVEKALREFRGYLGKNRFNNNYLATHLNLVIRQWLAQSFNYECHMASKSCADQVTLIQEMEKTIRRKWQLKSATTRVARNQIKIEEEQKARQVVMKF